VDDCSSPHDCFGSALLNSSAFSRDPRPTQAGPLPEAAVERRLHWLSEADTQAFAQRLARCMQSEPAFGNLYIELHGELGAGKTTLVRHLLRALGVQGRIKSPTYAVVEPHDSASLPIWHFDFYRFSDPREWEDAGFRELFASHGLKIAEWPDKAAGHVPPADLAVHIQAMTEDARTVDLHAHSASGLALLQACGIVPSPAAAASAGGQP
jgi:tRNA threonylcarbamoyladenosine biosynthesis protein TsaE